jgi:hypothetical protein
MAKIDTQRQLAEEEALDTARVVGGSLAGTIGAAGAADVVVQDVTVHAGAGLQEVGKALAYHLLDPNGLSQIAHAVGTLGAEDPLRAAAALGIPVGTLLLAPEIRQGIQDTAAKAGDAGRRVVDAGKQAADAARRRLSR